LNSFMWLCIPIDPLHRIQRQIILNYP